MFNIGISQVSAPLSSIVDLNLLQENLASVCAILVEE